ncbi:hypothetical protein BKA93DRAFT_801711 [Sparassis latifolia]
MVDVNERVEELHEIVLAQAVELAALRQTMQLSTNTTRSADSGPAVAIAAPAQHWHATGEFEELVALVQQHGHELVALRQTVQQFVDTENPDKDIDEANGPDNASDTPRVVEREHEHTIISPSQINLEELDSKSHDIEFVPGEDALSSPGSTKAVHTQYREVPGSSRDLHRTSDADRSDDHAQPGTSNIVKKISPSPIALPFEWLDNPLDLKSEDVKPPRKKPKLIVEVVLPPTRSNRPNVSSQATVQARDRKKPLASSKAPQRKENIRREVKQELKVEIGEDILNEDAIADRLHPIGLDPFPVTLDSAIRSVMFSRTFTSKVFGGPILGLRPSVVPKHPKGFKDFLYPTLDMNPHLPREPGHPGLLCRVTRAVGDEGWAAVSKVFVRWGVNRFQYMGDYKLSQSDKPLSPEEFRNMPKKMQNAFASLIAKRSQDKDVRARLHLLRKYRREPTAQELQKALAGKNKFIQDPDDIMAAFESGNLIIALWCMKCIAYDEELQRELAEKYPGFLENRITKTEPKRKGKGKEEAKPSNDRGAHVLRKRKRSQTNLDTTLAKDEEFE